MQNKLTISLKGNAIVLRPLAEADLDFTLYLRNELRENFSSSMVIDRTQHLHWFKNWLHAPKDFIFVVWLQEQRIGQASLYNVDESTRTAEIGRFMVHPNHQRKGYMKSVIHILSDFAKKELHINKLHLTVLQSNTRACALYKSLGFCEEINPDFGSTAIYMTKVI